MVPNGVSLADVLAKPAFATIAIKHGLFNVLEEISVAPPDGNHRYDHGGKRMARLIRDAKQFWHYCPFIVFIEVFRPVFTCAIGFACVQGTKSAFSGALSSGPVFAMPGLVL